MKSCILVFSHSNYVIKPTGTEKCIRELTDVFSKKDVVTIQIFSIYNRLSRIFDTQIVGVNFGHSFLGLYSLSELPNALLAIFDKYDLFPVAIHIHHLANFKLKELEKLFQHFNLRISLFIHDYHTVCASTNMIDSKGLFCGVSFPDKQKCLECGYYKQAKSMKVRKFLLKQRPFIHTVFVPSLDVYIRWTTAYPEFKDKAIVRSHLTFGGCYKREYRNGHKIKIAFVGSQLHLKGYDDWLKLVGAFEQSDSYEFHYFGNPISKPGGVVNHFVSTATGGKDAMITSLRENNIDLVFLWSKCPETFSYVYFEASAAGAVIITNPQSGNVASMVLKEGNGLVFSNVEEVVAFLNEKRAVDVFLKNFFGGSHFAPEVVTSNMDVSHLIPEIIGPTCRLPVMQKKTNYLCIPTYLYAKKHKINICKV